MLYNNCVVHPSLRMLHIGPQVLDDPNCKSCLAMTVQVLMVT